MIDYVKEIICGKSNSHANIHLSCFYIDLQNISKYIFYTANELFINRDLILEKCTQWANFSILYLQEIFLLLLEYISLIYIWTQKSTFPSVLRLLVKGIRVNRLLYNQRRTASSSFSFIKSLKLLPRKSIFELLERILFETQHVKMIYFFHFLKSENNL